MSVVVACDQKEVGGRKVSLQRETFHRVWGSAYGVKPRDASQGSRSYDSERRGKGI